MNHGSYWSAVHLALPLAIFYAVLNASLIGFEKGFMGNMMFNGLNEPKWVPMIGKSVAYKLDEKMIGEILF